MFYIAFLVAGAILVVLAAVQYRRAEKKAWPIAVMVLGLLLAAAGGIFAFLITSGQLTLPLN